MSNTTHTTKKADSLHKKRDRTVVISVGKPVHGVSKVYAGFRPIVPANAATDVINLLNGYLIQHPAQSPADRLAAIKLMHEVKERLRILSPALTAAHLAEAGEHFARKAQSGFGTIPEATAPTAKPRRARQ